MNKNKCIGKLRRLRGKGRGFWKVSIAALAISIFGVAGVWATLLTPDVILMTPLTVTANPDPSLPSDVQSLEKTTAPLLFDRATTTEFTAYGNTTVDASFGKAQTLRALKVYGAAPYRITVSVHHDGSWSTVSGWNNLDLAKLSDSWHSFELTNAVSGDAVRVAFKPSTHGSATGLKELELWGNGQRMVFPEGGSQLVTAVDGSNPPVNVISANATPDQVTVGRDGKTVAFNLGIDPARIKNAYLVYDSFGIRSWVSASRSINGYAALGGDFMFTGTTWTPQVERIQPAWLHQGSNQITFMVPGGTSGTYSVRHVRVLAELDNGSNFVIGASGNPTSDSNPAAAAYDGSTDTGWQPYGSSTGSKSTKPTLTLNFDRSTQVEGLDLYLADNLSGTIDVEYEIGGKWTSAGIPSINGRKLISGWNAISAPSAGPADGVRLTFANGAGSAGEIRELRAIGSGVGLPDGPHFVIDYPDNGQYFGRTAYIRGFLQLYDNGSGPAKIFVGGKEVDQSDGAFGVLISKDDVGLSDQADGTPWSVDVQALYPDGQRVKTTVALDHPEDASAAHGALPSLSAIAAVGQPEMLEYDGAKLDIGAGAVKSTVKIKITGLDAGQLPPLDPGMTNVTRGPHRGYRFTPHPFHFQKAIKVTLPYDKGLIPAGMTTADIKTYFFDDETGHWEALQKYKLNQGKQTLTSLTNHFTDMINATVVVPTHPQAVSFNPTQIKGIKAANPGAGINLIKAPKANNTGTANLSYPIEIPAGRAGMQPHLAIQYNSSGGNGWLGLGWNLTTPSITVDTRWGVPRYSPKYETETYMLNGQDMTPLTYREGVPGNPTVKRFTDDGTNFHLRVEGSFQKIIRHGKTPSSYWWEVIDKDGTRSYYGGDPTDHQLSTAVLTGQGDLDTTNSKSTDPVYYHGVFKWMLVERIDPNGNFVKYHYDTVCDTGTGNGGNSTGGATCDSTGNIDSVDTTPADVAAASGYQLYLSSISYTGHGSNTGLYSILFERSQDRRHDVIINARGGFKEVTAKLLTGIKVEFDNKVLRSYELDYMQGAFDKSLLKDIIQYGDDGSLFNTHEFEYYNQMLAKPSGSGTAVPGFAPATKVFTGTDNLGTDVGIGSVGTNASYTAIGGTFGKNSGWSGYVGVGNWLSFKGQYGWSGGASFGGNTSSSDGQVTLMDINGDGLPDKVFMHDGKLEYRLNRTVAGSGKVRFDTQPSPDSVTDADIPAISQSNSTTTSSGVQGFATSGATGEADNSSTTTTETSYFADVNGDGLPDYIHDGTVEFNTKTSEAAPVEFSQDSKETDVPLGSGDLAANSLLPDFSKEVKKLKDEDPLMDAVRRWEAPYTGTIRITGGVQLVDTSSDRTSPHYHYKAADGVIVSIQYNNEVNKKSYLPWTKQIGPDDTKVYHPQGVSHFHVNAGDHIYFRVRSVDDGAYDTVNWSPVINYVTQNTTTGKWGPSWFPDVNKLNAYHFSAAADTVYGGQPVSIPAPYRGRLRLTGTLEKVNPTTDDIWLVISRVDNENGSSGNVAPKIESTVVYKKRIRRSATGDFLIDHSFKIGLNETVRIELKTDSPIDWTAIHWSRTSEGQPKLFYIEAYREAETPRTAKLAQPDAGATLPTAASDPTNNETSPITDSNGNTLSVQPKKLKVTDDQGNYLYQLPVAYNMSIYPVSRTVLNTAYQPTASTSVETPWEAPIDGVILVTPWVQMKHPTDCSGILQSSQDQCDDTQHDGPIVFTVKRRGRLLAKRIVNSSDYRGIANYGTIGATNYTWNADKTALNNVMAIRVKAHEKLFFDVSISDPNVAGQVQLARMAYNYGSSDTWTVPISDQVTIEPNYSFFSMSGDADSGALFVVRRGTKILAKKIYHVMNTGGGFTANIPLSLTKGEGLQFDLIGLPQSGGTTTATYQSTGSWTADSSGIASVIPNLQFQGSVIPAGDFTLEAYAGDNLIGQNKYHVAAGGQINSGEPDPLLFNSTAGQTVHFVYETSSYQLSSYLANKGKVEVGDAPAAQAWSVPSSWVSDSSSLVSFQAAPKIDLTSGAPDGDLVFQVLDPNNNVVGTSYIQIASGAVVPGSEALTLSAREDEPLRFVFTAADANLADHISGRSVILTDDKASASDSTRTVTETALVVADQPVNASTLKIYMPCGVNTETDLTTTIHQAEDDQLFGNPYRGWAYFGFNGNGEYGTDQIDESQVKLPTDKSDWRSSDSSAKRAVYIAYGNDDDQEWVSENNLWFISPTQMTSSRHGSAHLDVPDPNDYVGAKRVPKIGTSSNSTVGGGYYLSGSLSTGGGQSVLDMMDLNGDGFPDIVTPENVQFTNMTGGLGATTDPFGGSIRSHSETSGSLGLGVSAPQPKSNYRGVVSASGDRALSNPKYTPPSFPIPSLSYGSNEGGTTLMDINGDGLPDEVKRDSNGLEVKLNYGYAFSPIWEKWGTAEISAGTSAGISDSASLGSLMNVFGAATWNNSFSAGVSGSLNANYSDHTLIDVNGDGLLDAVTVDDSGQLEVAYNLGGEFAQPVPWSGAQLDKNVLTGSSVLSHGESISASANVQGTVYIEIPPMPFFLGLEIDITGGANQGETASRPRLMFADINGDGYVDSLASGSDDDISVALNQTGDTNLLKEVRRPMGGVIDIQYKRQGNTYDLPQSHWVMSQVQVFDGVKADDGQGASSPFAATTDYQVTDYKYSGGKYDRYERTFLGFGKVTQTQLNTTPAKTDDASPYRQVVQTYDTDSVYAKGLLLVSRTNGISSGSVTRYLKTVNKYDFYDVATSKPLTTLTDAVDPIFPELTRTEHDYYEGGPSAQKRNAQKFEYDEYGNVSRFIDEGDLDNPSDDVRAVIGYATCTSNSPPYEYIVGKANSIRVYDTGGTLLRHRKANIDCTTGNVTRVTEYNGGQAAITDLSYDPHNGNLTEVVGPQNAKGERYTLNYSYDGDPAQTYPTSISDSYQYTSSATYDDRWGKPLSTTDLNGNTIQYTYDQFGRPKTVVGPYESPNATLQFEYHPYISTTPDDPNFFVSYAETHHYDVEHPTNPIDTILFVDGLDRVIQTKKDASVAKPGQAPKDDMIVSGRVVYDGLGRVVARYYPTTEDKVSDSGTSSSTTSTSQQPDLNKNTRFDPGFDSERPTTMTYDVLDRVLTTTLPDTTVTTMSYGFGTDRSGNTEFKTSVVDDCGQEKDSFRDARQLVTSVLEYYSPGSVTNSKGRCKAGRARGTRTYWTSYKYDPLNEIVSVVDAKHNRTKVTYDKLGHRTSINNPDTGKTTFAYDPAGNLRTKTTAVGDVIHYKYRFNHLIGINYPRYPGNDVTYSYGSEGMKNNGFYQVGRVWKITDEAGTTIRHFGKLGETTLEKMTVSAVTEGPVPTYVTKYHYDTFARLLKLTLPNGEVIQNHYDSGGSLDRITGTFDGHPYAYLKSLTYDKFESRLDMTLGNGVKTHYRYRADNRRLNTLTSISPNGSVGEFQHLKYSYDQVGDITSLDNEVAYPAHSTLGGPANQTFKYDDLYRLVSAQGSFAHTRNRDNAYTMSMSYNSIDNIIHKTQVNTVGRPGSTGRTIRSTTYDWAYAYSGTQPHAPTLIGTRAYSYDANGNQLGYKSTVSGRRRAIDWDEENRIQAIHDPGHTATYDYDDTGRRVIKRGRYGETVYVNQFFTVRNGALVTENLFAGKSRIVSKVIPGKPIGTHGGNTGHGLASATYNGKTFTVTGTGAVTSSGTPIVGTVGSSANPKPFPGQGDEHRSARADEVARNTEKNKHLNGGIPGGVHGSANSNAGGNGGNAGGNGNGHGKGVGGGSSGGSGNGGGSAGNGNGGSHGHGGGIASGSQFLYFYHPDHLGSTAYVTDKNGKIYEHEEYFPFGESWVDDSSNSWRTPYLFTSKEYDTDTQLYYFGARYYDPRTSVWQSADPILGAYLSGKHHGGVFTPENLAMYSYVQNNPLIYTDPDGKVSVSGRHVMGELGRGSAYHRFGIELDSNADYIAKKVIDMATSKGGEHAADTMGFGGAVKVIDTAKKALEFANSVGERNFGSPVDVGGGKLDPAIVRNFKAAVEAGDADPSSLTRLLAKKGSRQDLLDFLNPSRSLLVGKLGVVKGSPKDIATEAMGNFYHSVQGQELEKEMTGRGPSLLGRGAGYTGQGKNLIREIGNGNWKLQNAIRQQTSQ